MQIGFHQLVGQLLCGRRQQGLAAGQHDMFAAAAQSGIDDGLECAFFTGGSPGRVGGITEPAAKIAATRSNKKTRCPGQFALALTAGERLTEQDRSQGQRRSGFIGNRAPVRFGRCVRNLWFSQGRDQR